MTDRTAILASWRLQLSELDFEAVHQAFVEHQAANALFCSPTTTVSKYPLNENVPVLAITEGQPGGERTKMIVNIWHSFTNIDECSTVKPALRDVVQVLHGTCKERPTPNELVSEQENDTHCMEVSMV